MENKVFFFFSKKDPSLNSKVFLNSYFISIRIAANCLHQKSQTELNCNFLYLIFHQIFEEEIKNYQDIQYI